MHYFSKNDEIILYKNNLNVKQCLFMKDLQNDSVLVSENDTG